MNEPDLTPFAQRLGYRNATRYETRAKFVFDGLPLHDARVLDVGCGPGAFTIWPALQGAKYVLGIEPELDGATAGTLDTLRRTVDDFGLSDRIDARSLLLSEIQLSEGPFDVVVTYNVVNHLDEWATMRLPGHAEAENRYRAIFRHIADLMAPNGTLIVADCARTNAWDKVGLTPPFARAIEWQKHLNPDDWSTLIATSGFELLDLRWSYLYPWVRLTSNRFAQIVTQSHFVLRMRRS